MPNEHDGNLVSSTTRRAYQIAAFACAIAFPLARYALPEDSYDPLWQRIAIGVLFLILGASSFISKWIQKHFIQITYSVLIVFNLWTLHLVFQNNLNTEYLVTYLLTLVSSAIIFRHFWWTIGFLSSIFIASLLLYPLLDTPAFSPSNFYASEATGMVIVALANRRVLAEQAQLRIFGERFKMISRASFDFADDGIVVMDLEGHVLQFNQPFLEMWGLDRTEVSSGRIRAGEERLLEQLENPEELNDGYHRAMAKPEEELFQELRLLDGRYIERHSKPLVYKGKIQARIWFYRDVSASKREKQELEQKRMELAKQNKLLVRLTGISIQPEEGLEGTLEEILDPSLQMLNVARVSVWRMSTDETTLKCIYSSGPSDDPPLLHSSIHIPDHQAYFQALRSKRIMAISDANADSHLESFRSAHPKLAAFARMDVPIREKGNCTGLISFHCMNARREWSLEEMSFANSVGDLVQLTVESFRRKEAEEEVARSNSILKSVFERSGIGISVTDHDARLLDFNHTFAEMWNLSAEMLAPGGESILVEHMNRQTANNSYSTEEALKMIREVTPNKYFTLKLVDGRLIERYIGELDLGMEQTGRIWYYRDITQQTKQEMALRKSEERNRAIVNAVPDMLLLINDQGALIEQKIPDGSVFQSLQGRHFQWIHDILPYNLAAQVRLAAEEVAKTGTLQSMESQMDFLDSERDLELRIVPSGTSEFLLIVRDVTQRKTTERELIQRNFELDSFVYRASHDLKAPLNSLMGLIDILLQESPPPEFLTYLRLMDRSVVKLDTFIRNLTDFSRITRLEIQHQEVNFPELMDEINESLQYMENSDRVKRQVQLHTEHPLVGDRFHIGIVISNLLSNAIKYQDHSKPESWVKIDIRVSPTEASVTVEDNGIGIPWKHQSKLFELFFRASNQSFGSGLGLYITKNAVEKMGGAIALKSEEGKGTTFSFFVPNHYEETVAQG